MAKRNQPDKLVVVANRLPVRRVRKDGAQRWETSPGGLVSALHPLLAGKGGTWVGWPGTPGKEPEPFQHDGMNIVPVRISKQELEDFYEGFSNRTLWPLYHDCVRPPEFRRRWWWPYLEVNQRFAERTAEVAPKKSMVWIQDYQLQLVPAMLRDLRPDLRIGFFLHIPFPPSELFAQLPWRKQTIEGILGSDVIGFQTRQGARNFIDIARRLTDLSVKGNTITQKGRKIVAQGFPISIDFDRYAQLADDPAVQAQAMAIQRRLGRHRRILLGVDRLDYTKGIDIRLKAYDELLSRGHVKAADVVFVQVAVPSREDVAEYIELRDHIERLVGRINGQYADVGQSAVQYLRRSLPPDELVAMYAAADVMVVTPFRDGMNLVAKEYVAARTNDDGALVLSEFTGAAHQLNQALKVNPHDVDGLASTLAQALALSESDRRKRMKALRATVRKQDVHAWANDFLTALAG